MRQPFKNSLGASSLQSKEASPLLQSRQLVTVGPNSGDSVDDFVLIPDSSAVVGLEWLVSSPPVISKMQSTRVAVDHIF